MGLALADDNCRALLSVISHRWLLSALIFRTWLTFTIALRCTLWNCGPRQTLLDGSQSLGGQEPLFCGYDPDQLPLCLERKNLVRIQ